MKIRYALFPFLFLMITGMHSCFDDNGKDPCGEAIGDATFNAIPPESRFKVIRVDTIADLATLRYTGTDWFNICTKDSVALRINVQGAFTKIEGCLHWSPADSVVFEVDNAGPVWSGSSPVTDISGVHGNGPGVIYTSIDFTFSYSDSSSTLTALHSHLSGIFTGMYIDPIGYLYK